MALTNAEKQKRYRERALRNTEGQVLTRLQVYLRPQAATNLNRLTKNTGMTKTELIDKAINDLAERLDCDHDNY